MSRGLEMTALILPGDRTGVAYDELSTLSLIAWQNQRRPLKYRFARLRPALRLKFPMFRLYLDRCLCSLPGT